MPATLASSLGGRPPPARRQRPWDFTRWSTSPGDTDPSDFTRWSTSPGDNDPWDFTRWSTSAGDNDPWDKSGMMSPMHPVPPELAEIRQRIDDLDRRLVALLAERSRLVDEVVHFKRARHMGVVDRGREDEMLARIATLAKDEGLDPRVAQHVLRTVIDGFTLLEVEELGPDDT